MPKTKAGEVISWKEFFIRWRAGIEGMTPVQKMKSDYIGKITNFIGLVVSLFAVAYFFKQFPNGYLALGLVLIFLGSAYSSFFTILALRQQIKLIENIDKEAEDKIILVDGKEGETVILDETKEKLK